MMLRLVTCFLPCLLLICCNKQGSPSVQKNEQTFESSEIRIKHTDQKLTDSKQATLRTPFETIDRIESFDMREKALADITWNAIETDPVLAHEAFQKLSAGSPEKIRLIQHYALRLSEQNVEEAIAWSEALSHEQEIAVAKYYIALSISETYPERAANMLSESGIAGREFDVAVVQLIQCWASKSVQDAAAWVAMFPPGPAREAGVQTIAQRWMKSDSHATFRWLENTNDEALRKETAKAITDVIDQQTPQMQQEWLRNANPSILAELRAQQ